jgi:hypothetical protein
MLSLQRLECWIFCTRMIRASARVRSSFFAHIENRTREGIQRHRSGNGNLNQHLAEVKGFLDCLATGGSIPTNPAISVRGPNAVPLAGKAGLAGQQAAQLLASIGPRHGPRSTLRMPLRERCAFKSVSGRVAALIDIQIQTTWCGYSKSWRRTIPAMLATAATLARPIWAAWIRRLLG